MSLTEARQYLVDKQATEKTVALFHNLKDGMGQRLLFGHQHTTRSGIAGGEWSDSTAALNRSDVKTATGYFPAVHGTDFGPIPSSLANVAAHAKKAYSLGGLVTISWHAKNPITGGSYTDKTGTPIKHILPGGSANATYREWLDQIADFAKNLVNVNGVEIPIIFRPFHEHNDSNFWWGASYCTPEEYKAAWRYTVEYLRDSKGVHNFLYAYSPNWVRTETEITERYPGDDYVDVVGFDFYSTNAVASARRVVEFAEPRNKIAALTEFGASWQGINTTTNANYYMDFLNYLKNDAVGKKIAWALTWTNTVPAYWVPVQGDIFFDSFIKFYNDPYTTFQNNMPDYYSYNFGAIDSSSPSVPANLSATAVSSSRINLSWTASTDNIGVSGYKIYRCSGFGCNPATQIGTATGVTYANTGLSANTAYTYRVAAYDAAGNTSGFSAIAGATTLAGALTDLVKDISGPSVVTIGQTVNVAVSYDASAARDLRVEFKQYGGAYTHYSGTRVAVSAGSGSLSVSVPIAVTAPAGSGYGFYGYLMPVGSDWYSRTAEKWQIGISAINSAKPGDLNADNKVDVTDLGIFLANWGMTTKPASDINQDGKVDVTDLGILLGNWG